ncbi:MAG: response regulator transcription factor [Actinomycetota bacterium]|nr:response regulator transcription factor [Actinomycetota bacterium]
MGDPTTTRLLLVEDDERMLDLLTRALGGRGYDLQVAADGSEALRLGMEADYDAVVLDVMIPPPDGIEVLRTWRTRGRAMPVLLLTARDAVGHRVEGLDAGADDYLTKPFAIVELFARIQRLLDRPPSLRPTVLRCGDLHLDPARHTVTRGETPVPLSAKEFALLHELMRHPGHVLTRGHLMEHLWDFSYDGDSNVIDVYIGYLRDKIDRPFGERTIETVRGVGYRLRPDSAGAPRRGAESSDGTH